MVAYRGRVVAIRVGAFASSGLGGPTRGRRLAALAILLAAPALYPLYTANVQLGSAPETLAATLTAHSIAREGNFDLREYFADGAGIETWRRYSLPEHEGAMLSVEPLVSSLSFVPALLPFRGAALSRWELRAIGNRVAAVLAIVAVVGLGWWLLSVTSIPRALVATSTVALATNHVTTVAAGLWSHTALAVWLVAGLALWSAAPRRPALYVLAGVALAAGAACRPIVAPALALVVVDAWRRDPSRRAAVATAVSIAAVAGLVSAGNWSVYGSLLGGRADVVRNISNSHQVASYFAFSPVHWAGLLFSPSRGLFVYAPFLLFALGGLVGSLRPGSPRTLRLLSLAGVLSFAAYGGIATWWGGWVFGPRYMTDLLPFFALWLALTPLPTRHRPLWAALFAAALGWSLWVQQLGVTRYPCGWNREPTSVDHDHARLWDWRDTQLARCLARHDAPSRRARARSEAG